jgi:hypothetical protein
MAHFAQIDGYNKVIQVIVADQDVINTGLFGDPALWIQTSYNTHGGVHTQGGTPLRKNYAGIGYSYDATRDAFIPPKNFDSWVLNTNKAQWKAPVDYPTDEGRYTWNEETKSWDAMPESA